VFLHTERRRFPVAIVGIALTVPVRILLARTAIPVYTWPFVLVTWGMLLLDRWFIQKYLGSHRHGAQPPVQA
jgi:urea transporter